MLENIRKIKLSLNTKVVWWMVAAIGLVDVVGLNVVGMKLVPHDFVIDLVAIAVMLTMTSIYTYKRPRPRIAALTHMGAIFLSFAAVTATASYLAATLHRPLIDDYLAAADQALGLDWMASYKWIMAHPLLYKVLYFSYSTIMVQIIFLLIYLNFRGRCGRAWEMIWLFMISSLICTVFSGLWPAVGAFGHYHVEMDRGYVQVFKGLHDGTLRVIGDTRVQGIIQFPSFHMALGILLIYVTRGMPILFLTFLELNILLIISTPAVGGHHYADLWGGALLALVTILIVRKIFAAGLIPDADKIASM
jgi:hypothetical protein